MELVKIIYTHDSQGVLKCSATYEDIIKLSNNSEVSDLMVDSENGLIPYSLNNSQ